MSRSSAKKAAAQEAAAPVVAAAVEAAPASGSNSPRAAVVGGGWLANAPKLVLKSQLDSANADVKRLAELYVSKTDASAAEKRELLSKLRAPFMVACDAAQVFDVSLRSFVSMVNDEAALNKARRSEESCDTAEEAVALLGTWFRVPLASTREIYGRAASLEAGSLARQVANLKALVGIWCRVGDSKDVAFHVYEYLYPEIVAIGARFSEKVPSLGKDDFVGAWASGKC